MSPKPSSAKRGARISKPEVLCVTARGLQLRVDGRGHFLGFSKFPFFRRATVCSLFRVSRPHAGHLRWPELDVDLELDSIERPQRYPLVSRGGGAVRERAAPRRRTR